MKINYFIRVALCCVLMVACQNNDPNKADSIANTEITNQLSDIMDSIGKIISTKNLDDGSIVMTDDKGNTITKDKDGNITIVTKEGETILIDNSIKEDPSATKDKWYHSTWKGRKFEEIIIVYPETDYYEGIINLLMDYNFEIETYETKMDSILIYQDTAKYVNLHFNNSTCSLQNIDSVFEITKTGTYKFAKYYITEQQVDNYKLVIKDTDYGKIACILENEQRIKSFPIANDSAIYRKYGYTLIDKATKALKPNVYTAFFNYRRVNDTQIAIVNNSTSYLLKEENSSNMPEMDVYQDGKSQSIYLKLVSL